MSDDDYQVQFCHAIAMFSKIYMDCPILAAGIIQDHAFQSFYQTLKFNLEKIDY